MGEWGGGEDKRRGDRRETGGVPRQLFWGVAPLVLDSCQQFRAQCKTQLNLKLQLR